MLKKIYADVTLSPCGIQNTQKKKKLINVELLPTITKDQ